MSMRTAVALVFIFLAATVRAQIADPQLLAEINKIKAIDNHSHPPKLVAPGEKDDDFDALPCDPLEPSDPTTITRPEQPAIYRSMEGALQLSLQRSQPGACEGTASDQAKSHAGTRRQFSQLGAGPAWH